MPQKMAHQYKNMTYSKPTQPAFIRDMLSGNSRASNGGREPIPERPVEDEYADPPSEEEGDEAPLVVQVRKRDLSQAEVQRGAFHHRQYSRVLINGSSEGWGKDTSA